MDVEAIKKSGFQQRRDLVDAICEAHGLTLEPEAHKAQITGTIVLSLQGRVWVADFSDTSLGAELTASLGSPIVATPFTKDAPLDHVRQTMQHRNPGCEVVWRGKVRKATEASTPRESLGWLRG